MAQPYHDYMSSDFHMKLEKDYHSCQKHNLFTSESSSLTIKCRGSVALQVITTALLGLGTYYYLSRTLAALLTVHVWHICSHCGCSVFKAKFLTTVSENFWLHKYKTLSAAFSQLVIKIMSCEGCPCRAIYFEPLTCFSSPSTPSSLQPRQIIRDPSPTTYKQDYSHACGSVRLIRYNVLHVHPRNLVLI